MKKRKGWKIDFRNIKVLSVLLACMVGIITIIAAPAIFAGSPPSGGTTLPPIGGNPNPNPQPPGDTTRWMMFIEHELIVYEGHRVGSNLLVIDNPNAIVEIVVRNYCGTDSEIIRVTKEPFGFTAVNEGTADIYVYARMDSGEIEYRRIRIMVWAEIEWPGWGDGGIEWL